MGIRIITDSTSDIRNQEIENTGIIVIPLNITFANESFTEGEDISVEEFYNKLVSEKSFPKTSQPSPNRFLEEFLKAKEAGDDVICITISSGLSGTYQSALIAAEMAEYDKIYVIDSKSCLTGLRLLTLQAYRLKQDGLQAFDIVNKIEDYKKRIHIFAICDTMEYFYKGGRINKALYLASSLLGIKAFISLDKDGHIIKLGQAIGMSRSFKQMTNDIKSHSFDTECGVCYGYTTLTDNYHEMVKKISPYFEEFLQSESQIGAVSGAHIGPGGICYAAILKEE